MKDLTKGKPSALILSFALPIFLGNLLQLTYSLVDTRIVGSFLGEELTAEERIKSRKSDTSYEEDMSEDFTYAHQCSNRALDFLEKYKEEDFFLVMHFIPVYRK
jgi:hypothetical protein